MNRIFWLTYNTMVQIVRQRILYTVLFFAISLIAVGGVLDSAAPGQKGIMVLDIGLGAINLFGVMISIVMGVNLLYQELDKKTVYNVLSKPVSRTEFVIGKYLGQVAAIAVVLSGMAMCLVLATWAAEGTVPGIAAQALWAIYLELMMVSAIAMLFSSFSTPYLSGLFTLGFWIVGSLASEIRNYQRYWDLKAYERAVTKIFYILPDFSKLNLKDRVPYNLAPPEGYVWQITLYALLYTAGLILVSSIIFRRRDFK